MGLGNIWRFSYAAGKNGGGIIYFPRGIYVLSKGLDLPRRVTLRGEDRNRVALQWVDSSESREALEDALGALGSVATTDLDFRVVLAGEPFVDQSEEYREAIEALGDRVIHRGEERAIGPR